MPVSSRKARKLSTGSTGNKGEGARSSEGFRPHVTLAYCKNIALFLE